MIPTRFLSARLYAGVFEVPRAAAWIVQRGTRHFTSHTNNLRLKIKPFNLHYVQFMFLYPLGVVPIQLQRSCNSAAAPHWQLKKNSHTHSQRYHNPTCKKTTNMNIFMHLLLVKFLSPCLLACSCTAAAPHIAIRRQALPFRKSKKILAQHKLNVFWTKLCLVHPKFTSVASPS